MNQRLNLLRTILVTLLVLAAILIYAQAGHACDDDDREGCRGDFCGAVITVPPGK